MKTKKHVPLFHRVLSFILALAMVVTLMPSMAFAEGTGTTLYLKPNANWQIDNARFAAYFFKDGGETWVDMTDTDGDGYYEVTVPDGYSSVIFCRMNPSTTGNNWGNKWNQSADLTVPTDGTNCYTVAEGAWDNGDGAWSTYEVEQDTVLYLKPNANWNVDNARFAAYFFEGTPNTWVSMADTDSDGYYEVVVPDGYSSVIFCRMNPATTENNWDNKWNQTDDLTVPTDDNNCYTITDGSWDAGAWSVYTPTSGEPDPAPTPTVDYYLVGYINGADYGCNNDRENLGEYKFTDGSLTATFTADSYVFVKTGDNANCYMTDGWLGTTATSATLSDSSTLGDNANKLFVPGNAEVTFTLTENSDGSLTLSYTQAGSGDEGDGEETSYTVTIHYHNTDNWAEVAAYLWSGADNGEWPGAVVSENADNAGWYDLVVSAEAAGFSFIFNNNNNGKQTGNLSTGTLTGDVELWIDGSSSTEAPEGWVTPTAVTLHFTKPTGWGNSINAYLWTTGGAVSGYSDYNTWPGKAISDTDGDGWYDLVVVTEDAFNFIFNDGSNQTADLATGEVNGNKELWVVGNDVYDEQPDYTAVIHFQKPESWSSVYAYVWDPFNNNAAIPGYESYNAWPGAVISENANNAGWYDLTITKDTGVGFNFIFNNGNGTKTKDLWSDELSLNTELWFYADENSTTTAPTGWTDPNRTIHVPGTFSDPTWDAASNQMTYDSELGLYFITFENVTPGTYEYKIAANGSWNENYGVNGEANGDNIKVVVPTAQDVTIWYSDNTHQTVCSIYYDIDADITLSGTGIAENTKLTDPGLTGTFSVTVDLSAGTYSDLKVTYKDKDYSFNEFTMEADKAVTFWFDPSTGLAYHNGSDVKVETDKIYYTTKDLDYKDPFGAVAAGEEITFSIDTGIDASAVNLIVKGYPSVGMTKDGDPVDGVQHWTCTTSFDSIGEYEYYFAITNGSDMVFYCDDIWNNYYSTGDYGEGGIGNANDIFAYDLVVYEAGFETPDWMKNAVIYQIFPDRFFDGDESNNQAQTWARGTVDYEYVTDWYLLPENPEQLTLNPDNYPDTAFKGDGEYSNEIYGGDLQGIIERIDYLKALGVNVIYLNPVFWSISNHRYDAVSYTEIDPILGTLGDFEELVAVAEANDMHIILDGVFNHVSDDSVYFDRYYKFLGTSEKIGAYPYWAYVYDYMAENGADQATAEAAAKTYFSENYDITDYTYTEWFAVSSTPMTGAVDSIGLRAGKPVYSYEGWWGYDSMPVIYSTNGSEYQTGDWAETIIGNEDGTAVGQYWISKGSNGWRLDVANEVSDETWQNFRDSVKALDSEAVIIGEIWADATHYLMGDMYDSVMNYVFRDAVAGFARGYLINRDNKSEKYDSDLTADEAMTILEILRERYPEEAFYAMMNLVASHDTSRILSYLDDVEDDRYQKDLKNAFPTYEGTSDRAKQLQYVVSFLQFTYAGAPTIYYGDEIGMVGGDDPDDRRAMTWGKGNQDIVEWYAELAAIRAAYPALRTGSVEAFSSGNNDVMSFVRSDSSNTLVIMANRAASAQTIAYEGTWVDVITGTTYTDSITVPAYRGVILVAEDEVKEITVDKDNLAPASDPLYIVKERCAHIFGEGVVTEPTCTEEGYTTYTCTKEGCEYSYTDDYVDAKDHDWDEGEITTDPTCTEAGEKTYTCKNDSQHTYTEPVDALDHDYDDGVVTDPTCTEKGYTTYTCTRQGCGHSYTDDYVNSQGHSYGDDGICGACGDHKETDAETTGPEGPTNPDESTNPEEKEYIILSGGDSNWKKASGTKIVIICNGEYGDFTGLLMDGAVVDSSKYTVAEGSTIVTLESAYLETLSVGKHTVTFKYVDGEVSTGLTVLAAAATEPENPGTSGDSGNTGGDAADNTGAGTSQGESADTGDDFNGALWMSLLLISVLSMTAVALTKKNWLRK